ncbi:MAG: hypothetical protein AB1641_20905 [Thermodesulfobacteriota bacterium]
MNRASETTIFLEMMKSLDSAFALGQGLPESHSSEWGRKVFEAVGSSRPGWFGEKRTIYLEASRLLYLFSVRGLGLDFALDLHRRPEAFARTVLLILRGHRA